MTDLNPDHLRAALNVFGHADEQNAGGFADALLEAMVRADLDNLDKLATAFPTFGAPFKLIKLDRLGTPVALAALACLEAGVQVRSRDIDPGHYVEGKPRFSRAGWLYIDIRDGIAVQSIIERELRIAAGS